jgi:hypothetical protein
MERSNDKRAADSRSQQVRLIELELDDLQRRQQQAIEKLTRLRDFSLDELGRCGRIRPKEAA